MQTIGDRADFPAGPAVSGSSTADSPGINGPFTVCDVLMRERDALVYHRQMLKRKRTQLEQALQKQRSEKEVCPAFAVLSSWSTPIASRVGATGMTEYQKSFHAHYLTRTLQLVKEISLCSANQVAVMRALTTVHPAPMLRRLELEVPELSEAMVQSIYQLEAEGQLEFVALRLHQVTPALRLLYRQVSLKTLNLSGTRITDEDVRQLSKCHTIMNIDLHSCKQLTNVNPLSSIATLEIIKLPGCTFLTHVGALGKLPALKEADLRDTPVTDEEVDALKSLREQLGLLPCVIDR